MLGVSTFQILFYITLFSYDFIGENLQEVSTL